MHDILEQFTKNYDLFIDIQNINDTKLLLKTKGDRFIRSILTDKECKIFTKFKNLKRKIEWISGRMAAKQAFAGYQKSLDRSGQLSDISVLNNRVRAPLIVGHPELHVSISHSHEKAIAAVAPFEIGIDIEKIEQRPNSLAYYFLCREELSIFANQQNNKDDLITRFWSRKEAISKFLQLGGKLNFKHVNTVNSRVYLM
jgi:phosphopantetheinyl transferase (holo-ACP synthase)